MKTQIRYKTFETNSSSQHTLTLMLKEDYLKQEREADKKRYDPDWFWDTWCYEWISKNDIIQQAKKNNWFKKDCEVGRWGNTKAFNDLSDEEIFNILQASDKQLVALFKKHNDKKQLIYALFYEETKKIVCECSGTDILANHYNAYFQLLDDYEIIKKYIASKLLEQTFVRVPLPKVDYSEEVYSLQNLIVSQFLEYNLKCLYYIYGLMHDVTSYEDFTLRFSKILIENFHDQEIQSTEYDEFDDAEETTKDYTVDILNLLEYKMGGRKKND